MTTAVTVTILRQFNEWRRGDYAPEEQPASHKITAAIDAAVEMIERMGRIETVLQDHHANAMCKGYDHSHPLTQFRLSAYQQSKLYADTVFALEK